MSENSSRQDAAKDPILATSAEATQNSDELAAGTISEIHALSAVESAMVKEATNALGGSDEVRSSLNDIVQASRRLQAILPEGSDIYFFVSGKKSNSEEIHLFTLVKFHQALASCHRSPTIVSQAIRDLFIMARRFIAQNNNTAQNAEPPQVHDMDPVHTHAQHANHAQDANPSRPETELVLPGWFPWTGSIGEDVSDSQPTYIF